MLKRLLLLLLLCFGLTAINTVWADCPDGGSGDARRG